jgi:hypothetical protein
VELQVPQLELSGLLKFRIFIMAVNLELREFKEVTGVKENNSTG